MKAKRKARRHLPQANPEAQRLGLPTIMNPELAQRYGARYVHWAVFAIDVDRAAQGDLGYSDVEETLGWEVFLTEYWMVSHLDPSDRNVVSLVEETCFDILDDAQAAHRLGSQLVFAVWNAAKRDAWPTCTAALFEQQWSGDRTQLAASLKQLWTDPDKAAEYWSGYCLQIPFDPPMARSTRAALEAMVATDQSIASASA